ncbi:diaminopimelate decarboxylase [Candidatus Saccharibacteria bacterium]|nr:diaminopimelate decarboxylase [Candidatus Saccharibacteria bacterium]
MSKLNDFNSVDSDVIFDAAQKYGTPLYLYDEQTIVDKCKTLLAMPNAFGLTVRYAMKANSTKAILQIIHGQGLKIDASSMNEARRAHLAGIPYEDIMLTTQEAPVDQDLRDLENMMHEGLKYNVCSVRQLQNIADFAAANEIKLSMRVHPGVGTGESAAHNTGDHYSCYGVHLSDLEQALKFAKRKEIVFDLLHIHIGSGGDPETWRENIDHELSILEEYFPGAETVSFGGGLKEVRMPDGIAADIQKLGQYAKEKIEQFGKKTGRKLKMEIEPGTFVVANAGFIVAKVVDKKQTGVDGLKFIILNGGMDMSIRPLLYGSQHPFYIVSKAGELLSSEFAELNDEYTAAIVGTCCETGDSQCLNDEGLNTPRQMSEPEIGDYVAIGGAGAYCSTMSPMNYNSHLQAPEVLYTRDKELKEIRLRQTLEQMLANEI